VMADAGAVIDQWIADADQPVYALASDGNAIYLGGDFFTVGGQARSLLAAVDPLTAKILDWAPNPIGETARALAVGNGTIYAGGQFNAGNRANLISIDNKGTVGSWS